MGDYSVWGSAMAMSADGETIVVGADAGYRGMVQVFEWKNDDWVLKGQSIWHGQTDRIFPNFGQNVAISGDGNTFALSSKDYVQVFTFDASTNKWVQKGSDDDDNAYTGGYSTHTPTRISRQFRARYADISLSDDGNVIAFYKQSGWHGKGEVYKYQESGDWQLIGEFEGEMNENYKTKRPSNCLVMVPWLHSPSGCNGGEALTTSKALITAVSRLSSMSMAHSFHLRKTLL